MRRFLPLAIAALASAPAAADEVELTNGRTIGNCIAVVEDGRVRVELGGGSVTFDEKDVVAIRPGDCPLKEVPARMAAAGSANSAAAWVEFAAWCGSSGISKHVRPALEKAIQLDPDHAPARAGLGHRKIQGKWLWGDALQQALGFVKFEGRWMTPIEMELERRNRRDRSWGYGYGSRYAGWWDGATVAFSLFDLIQLKGGVPAAPAPTGQASDLPGLKPTPAFPGP